MGNNANNMHVHNACNGSNIHVNNASDVDLTMSKPASKNLEVQDFKKQLRELERELAKLEKKLGKCDRWNLRLRLSAEKVT